MEREREREGDGRKRNRKMDVIEKCGEPLGVVSIETTRLGGGNEWNS